MLDSVGPALCLLSAACFGAMAVFGKLAYEAGVSPGALLLVRFGLAAAVLGVLLLLRPGLRRGGADEDPPAAAGGQVLVTALGLGAVGYAAQASLFFSALELMDASLLSLILYTYPVLVTVAAVLLGRDRLTPGRLVALLAASSGMVLVLLGAGGMGFHPLGALLAFGAAVVYTSYILVADTVVHRLPPVVLSTLVMTGPPALSAYAPPSPVASTSTSGCRDGSGWPASPSSPRCWRCSPSSRVCGGPARPPPPSCRPSNPWSPRRSPRSSSVSP